MVDRSTEPDQPGSGQSTEPDQPGSGQSTEPDQSTGTDGAATYLTGIIGRTEPFASRPRASIVHEDETTKIVAFEFGEGHELAEHAAHHPVLIQLLRGRVEFGLPDRTLELQPGEIVHLTPRLRHSVRALEPTTLTVTMLLPHS